MLHIQVQGASPVDAAAASGRAEPEEGAGAAEAGEAGAAATDRDVRIFSGNPLVRTLRGTVRLFLDAPGPAAKAEDGGGERGGSRLVCIFAVPSYMSAPELLDFVGRDIEAVEQVRIVRDSQPARFLALLQFQSAESAGAFLHRVSGHPFNSIEPERCHAYFAETVQFVDEEGTVQSTHVGSLDRRVPADPLHAFPLGKDAVRELPKCPVCLERLDTDMSGVVTTMCNHTCVQRWPPGVRGRDPPFCPPRSFHCDCLSGWRDSTCPVCRYCAQEAPATHACEVCGVSSNVWMCLVCGRVGCGRYDGRHMFRHYEETGHAYCLHLETQRVWDYAGDGFVHRLVMNKLDGKMIELPAPTDGGTGAAGMRSQQPTHTDAVEEGMQKEKLESIALVRAGRGVACVCVGGCQCG